MAPPKAFVLHLARAISRRPQVDRLLQTLPLPAEVIDAVDGARLTPEDKARAYRRELWSPSYPFALCDAEIGVFLSHRQAWRRIVAEDLEFALILEDDVEVDPERLNEILAMARFHRPSWRYLLLPRRRPAMRGAVVASNGRVAFQQPKIAPLGAMAQIVTRAAAHQLLMATAPFDRPIDVAMQMTWRTGLPVTVCWPSGITDVAHQLGGTTVAKRKLGLMERLDHEVSRPIYRAEIALIAEMNDRMHSLAQAVAARRPRSAVAVNAEPNPAVKVQVGELTTGAETHEVALFEPRPSLRVGVGRHRLPQGTRG